MVSCPATRKNTYQEFIDRLRDLVLGSRDGDDIASLLGTRKGNLAVPLLLQILNLGHASDELSVVQSVDDDMLRNVLGVNLLNHVHDLLLDEFQIVGVPGGSATDDIVDLDIVVIFANTSTVHGIGELDKDRVFLHDALDVLSADADDTLVVLVRDVKRDRGRHLKLNEVQSVLGGFVVLSTDIDIEIVLVEAIKDDLDITLTHDFVDLSILLAADEFLVLIGELDLDSKGGCGSLSDEWQRIDDGHGSLDGIIAAVDVEVKLFKVDLGTRIDADVRKHGANLGRSGCSLVRSIHL